MHKLPKFEVLLYAVLENVIFITTSAIELYSNKYSYNQSFFLAVVAQEELAKLIILPIANEINEIENLTKNRNGKCVFFHHILKQKIFTSYGLQKRNADGIQELKNACLYVGISKNLTPNFERIKPDQVYIEIKHTVKLLTKLIHNILQTSFLTKDLKKIVILLLDLLKGCINDKLPSLKESIVLEASEISKSSPKIRRKILNEEILTNPFKLITIFKAIYKDDYKKHLKNIMDLPFDRTLDYLVDN